QSAEMMHRSYFDGLVSAAWADGEMTADELNDVRAVGTALSIAGEVIETALQVQATGSPTLSTGFTLTPGDVVVITGETRRARSEWFELLASRGLVPHDNIVKKAKLLVAADPDSMSDKARKAREYGIPIVNEAGLERLLSS
ncbi:MAG: polymerase epsilon subunit, partial [Cryobacterium sp.]|nr:polymerase epsilon subunit [Cryobacterium sp.]